MVDFLFALGQFVCVVGLFYGAIKTISNWKQLGSSESSIVDATTKTIQPASVPSEQLVTIQLVALESGIRNPHAESRPLSDFTTNANLNPNNRRTAAEL